MGKITSKLTTVLGRLLKVAMAAVVLPFAAALLVSFLEQLDVLSLSGPTYRQLTLWGAWTYIGVHLFLYRPKPLFQASHRLFSTLAAWLFGGQVASTEGGSKGKAGKGAKGDGAAKGQGSTLVAFSPFVIPFYTVLVCAAGWAAGKWLGRGWVDGPAGFLIGMTAMFHWLMTAEALQERRKEWHLETYLLAIGLVFALTLLLGGACLPWAIPEFSFVRALAESFRHAQSIYTTLVQHLFF